MCLFESVVIFFEGVIKCFYWLWLCKVISEGKFYGVEVGFVLFGVGGLRFIVMVVYVAGGRGGAS